MQARDIINYFLIKSLNKRYLEIGLHEGFTFNSINANVKDSVDPDQSLNATYKMSSDDFFHYVAPTLGYKYDVIFIDGLHHTEQVDKDIQNSLNFLNDVGHIVLHDCNPISEMRQRVPADFDIWKHGWNGDVWKSVVKFRKNYSHQTYKTYVVDTDEGIGIIKNNFPGNPLNLEIPDKMDYSFLETNRSEILNLVTEQEFHSIEIDDFIKSYNTYWKEYYNDSYSNT
jgi:hypothetical protein